MKEKGIREDKEETTENKTISQEGNTKNSIDDNLSSDTSKKTNATLDVWTPGGMLCNYTTASITVKGSLWDDFHISVLPNY